MRNTAAEVGVAASMAAKASADLGFKVEVQNAWTDGIMARVVNQPDTLDIADLEFWATQRVWRRGNLQNLDIRAGTFHPEADPSDAGTEHQAMKLSRYSDYTLRVCLYLATHTDRFVSIPEIVEAYGLPRSNVMKLASDMVSAGIFQSLRGRSGGLPHS